MSTGLCEFRGTTFYPPIRQDFACDTKRHTRSPGSPTMRFTINSLGSIGLLFQRVKPSTSQEKTLNLPQSHNVASFEIVFIEPQSVFVD